MHLIAYADGASRGNPGPAAYGAVLCDADGLGARRLGQFHRPRHQQRRRVPGRHRRRRGRPRTRRHRAGTASRLGTDRPPARRSLPGQEPAAQAALRAALSADRRARFFPTHPRPPPPSTSAPTPWPTKPSTAELSRPRYSKCRQAAGRSRLPASTGVEESPGSAGQGAG